jgi:hypothetical protein
MLTGLAILVDVEIEVTIFYVEEGSGPRTGECGQQQDRCHLDSLSFVGEDIDVGSPGEVPTKSSASNSGFSVSLLLRPYSSVNGLSMY